MSAILDYVIFRVPHGIDLDDPDTRGRLDGMAERLTMRQYKGKRPRALLFGETDWIITSDWRDVERFQPAHRCPTCLAANDQAVAHLKEHPSDRLALGNLTYEEIW